jgi:hypothetical protein
MSVSCPQINIASGEMSAKTHQMSGAEHPLDTRMTTTGPNKKYSKLSRNVGHFPP